MKCWSGPLVSRPSCMMDLIPTDRFRLIEESISVFLLIRSSLWWSMWGNIFRCGAGLILTASSSPSESRQTDRIGSPLIASNHLSLNSDSRGVSNRKHFGRNTGPTCPWARDIEGRQRERERDWRFVWKVDSFDFVKIVVGSTSSEVKLSESQPEVVSATSTLKHSRTFHLHVINTKSNCWLIIFFLLCFYRRVTTRLNISPT